MEIKQSMMTGVISSAWLKQKPIIIAAKVAITVTAFVVLAIYIDFDLLISRLRSIKPSFAVLAIGIAALQVVLVGFRWRLIIASIATPAYAVPSHRETQAIMWTSQLFNQFMPFAVGEILRIILLNQAGVSLRVAFKSALLDRSVAVLALVLLCVISLLIAPPTMTTGPYLEPLVFVLAIAIGFAVVLIVWAEPISRYGARWRVVGAITEMLRDLRRLFDLHSNGPRIFSVSAIVHLLSVASFFALAKGYSAPLSIADAFIVVPLMVLVSMIPISLGGWGVRESFVVLLLAANGMDSGLALLLSLSFGTVYLIAALPGVITLMLSNRPLPVQSSSELRHRPSSSAMYGRKRDIYDNSERYAAARAQWRRKASFFHAEDIAYLRFLIPSGKRILDLGCGAGETLAALEPSYGVGIDFSPSLIEQARRAHPDLEFHVGDVEARDTMDALRGPFDFILVMDTFGALQDCQALLESLHPLCRRETRLVVVYYSHLWDPLLKLAEWVGLRRPQPPQNVISPADLRALAELGGFDPVKSEIRLLSPFRLLGIGRLINRFVSPLPLVRPFALRHYLIARSAEHLQDGLRSATVVIPARNERGNIEPAVRRLPQFCEELEIIFVEGHSSDGTLEEMHRVKAAYPDRDITVMVQPGKGKADAVFAAFDVAKHDVLMILDADLTVPPEQLSKFWNAIRAGKGEFVNGSRLVYPMEDEAMRFLNLIANRTFSYLFSWLLNQRYTDTLCGTKVLRRSDYARLKAGRAYFGDFDPFGDFDLIFGASKLCLKVAEIPIRYASRTYGETQISRFRHGFELLKMVIFAFFKIKAL